MLTVFLGGIFFFLSVIIHLIICRLDPDKKLKTKLFMVLALQNLLAFCITAFWMHGHFILTCSVIYIIFIPIYLIFYVTTELVSPSKKILQIVQKKPGANYEHMFKELEKENFIMTRLEELQQSGCVRREQDKYMLSPSGQAIAGFLDSYQQLLGRQIGG